MGDQITPLTIKGRDGRPIEGFVRVHKMPGALPHILILWSDNPKHPPIYHASWSVGSRVSIEWHRGALHPNMPHTPAELVALINLLR